MGRILAHRDSITQVHFIPNTHNCFSAGKDPFIRCWNCETLEELFSLKAHHNVTWNLLVSNTGDLVISTGHDRSIRCWERKKKINNREKLSKNRVLVSKHY